MTVPTFRDQFIITERDRADAERIRVNAPPPTQEQDLTTAPPPAPFEVGGDIERTVDATIAMLEGLRYQGGEDALRRLARLTVIQKAVQGLVGEHATFGRLSNDSLFARHIDLPPDHPSGYHRLLVHDLNIVWNGETWEGDGACSFNQRCRWADDKTRLYFEPRSPEFLNVIRRSGALKLTMGEREWDTTGHIPSGQTMRMCDMKPGDYLLGELYLTIC